MKHNPLMHILGCALPLLFIFILPSLGVSGDALTFIFIILMFACHFMMLGGRQHDERDEHIHGSDESKGGQHGCH